MASMSVGSVALWGRVQRKDNAFLSGRKLSPPLTLMPDPSLPSCITLVPFKLLSWYWNSERVSLSKSVFGFFKRSCLRL